MAFALGVAWTPLALSVVIGFYLLDRGVIDSYADVSYRMHQQIEPVQRLRLHIQGALVPVDEYLEDRQAQHLPAYRLLRTQVEEEFVTLSQSLNEEQALQTLLQQAHQDWQKADELASQLLHTVRQHSEPALVEAMLAYHGRLESAIDKLAAIYHQLDAVVEEDYRAAGRYYERSLWILGIAAVISLFAMITSVRLVGRLLSASVDRLVEGALKFAGGEREHRIDVVVPPELGRVAEEFNHMIERIHKSESKLEEIARRDPLTGLANRRDFDETLPEMRAQIDRFGEQWAVLAMDVDHFKAVNDTHGHAAGDEVLKQVSAIMAANLRPYDRLFRTGGEEFTVLMPRADRQMACDVAERLRATIGNTVIPYKDIELRVTVSVGIALSGQPCDTAALMETADNALYQAKTNGRNRCVVG
ncbi:diguanylate cyclase [Parahaliea mediterranea]|uniref:diguanylate cyclase n=1 Tax=Parahaliea mediterranea TaxID=651086 RepID=UPI0014740759|nr:diguanylate cyclase [Parahaliea mediterranea]